jgi:hypothetical protein
LSRGSHARRPTLPFSGGPAVSGSYRGTAVLAGAYRGGAPAPRRQPPRLTVVAATAAAAGVLGASGFAAGAAAPWDQLVRGLSGPSQAASGAFLFDTLTGTRDHAGLQAGVLQSAAGSGSGGGGGGVTDVAAGKHAKAAPAATAAKPAGSKAYVGKHAARATPALKASARTYLFYDSINPEAAPAGEAVAAYATGTYASTADEVAGRQSVLWIDTRATDPAASVLDVEPGDASPAAAAQWVRARLSAHPQAVAILYTSKSEWPQLQAAVSGLPAAMLDQIRYWIADPTGQPHVLDGASATQWYWGDSYDISTARADFDG